MTTYRARQLDTYMNQRFTKWNTWLDIIYNQVTELAVHRHIFLEVQHIIKANERIQKSSSFYSFLGTSYVTLAVMGARRQLKQDPQSVSFARLLQEIIDTPEVLSRKQFVALYKDSVVSHWA